MSDTGLFIVINGISYDVDIKFNNERGVKFTPYGFVNCRVDEPHQTFIAYINIYRITCTHNCIKVNTQDNHMFTYTCSTDEVAQAYAVDMNQRWFNYIYTDPSQTRAQLKVNAQIEERLSAIEDILRYAPPPLPASQQFTEARERFESNIKEL